MTAGGAVGTIALAVDSPPDALGEPGEHACSRLIAALERHGWRVERTPGGRLPSAGEAAAQIARSRHHGHYKSQSRLAG